MSFYNTPKFFKIIQNHELQNGELRVPKKFVEKYWKGIPNPVVIKLPNGVQQQLFWVKRDGDVWFQKNWDKFAKFLKFGYVVLFTYTQRSSCFQLEIFRLDALEMDYSTIKFIDENGAAEAEVNKEAQEFIHVSDDENEIHKQYSQRTENGKRKISSRNWGGMNKKAKNCTKAETNVASTSQRRKIGVTNNNNPSFELRLKPTYAKGNCFRIPFEFSTKYMKGFEGNASVRVAGEDEIWKLIVKYDSVTKYSIVNGGWRSFTKENNLQIGDVCKFEMIQTEPLTFTVTIIRARHEPRPDQLRGPKGPSAMKRNTLTFKIVVNSTYPYVPKEVLSRHGEECHGKFVKLKVGRKLWCVRLYVQPAGIRFYRGWTKFKEECTVEIGDTCLFELIDEEKLVFRVSIERKKP